MPNDKTEPRVASDVNRNCWQAVLMLQLKFLVSFGHVVRPVDHGRLDWCGQAVLIEI